MACWCLRGSRASRRGPNGPPKSSGPPVTSKELRVTAEGTVVTSVESPERHQPSQLSKLRGDTKRHYGSTDVSQASPFIVRYPPKLPGRARRVLIYGSRSSPTSSGARSKEPPLATSTPRHVRSPRTYLGSPVFEGPTCSPQEMEAWAAARKQIELRERSSIRSSPRNIYSSVTDGGTPKRKSRRSQIRRESRRASLVSSQRSVHSTKTVITTSAIPRDETYSDISVVSPMPSLDVSYTAYLTPDMLTPTVLTPLPKIPHRPLPPLPPSSLTTQPSQSLPRPLPLKPKPAVHHRQIIAKRKETPPMKSISKPITPFHPKPPPRLPRPPPHLLAPMPSSLGSAKPAWTEDTLEGDIEDEQDDDEAFVQHNPLYWLLRENVPEDIESEPELATESKPEPETSFEPEPESVITTREEFGSVTFSLLGQSQHKLKSLSFKTKLIPSTLPPRYRPHKTHFKKLPHSATFRPHSAKARRAQALAHPRHVLSPITEVNGSPGPNGQQISPGPSKTSKKSPIVTSPKETFATIEISKPQILIAKSTKVQIRHHSTFRTHRKRARRRPLSSAPLCGFVHVRFFYFKEDARYVVIVMTLIQMLLNFEQVSDNFSFVV